MALPLDSVGAHHFVVAVARVTVAARSFLKPQQSGRPVIRYRESESDRNWKEVVILDQTEGTTIKVTDLSPSTKYDVTVVAVHEDESGHKMETASSVQQITTKCEFALFP